MAGSDEAGGADGLSRSPPLPSSAAWLRPDHRARRTQRRRGSSPGSSCSASLPRRRRRSVVLRRPVAKAAKARPRRRTSPRSRLAAAPPPVVPICPAAHRRSADPWPATTRQRRRAALVPGPGTGSGARTGTGSGRFGNGEGGGGVTPARWLHGRIKDPDSSAGGRHGRRARQPVHPLQRRRRRPRHWLHVALEGNALLDATTCRLVIQRYRYKSAATCRRQAHPRHRRRRPSLRSTSRRSDSSR